MEGGMEERGSCGAETRKSGGGFSPVFHDVSP